jgi:hypothetical protein
VQALLHLLGVLSRHQLRMEGQSLLWPFPLLLQLLPLRPLLLWHHWCP